MCRLVSKGARWATMLLPGAELVYVVLRWENAKAGSVVCALSLGFGLPLVGQLALLSNSSSAKGMASAQSAWKQVIDSEARRKQKEQEKAWEGSSTVL